MDRHNQKFLNRDGSFNLEAAMVAGRNARSKGLSEGWRIFGDAAMQMALMPWRALVALSSRCSSSRIFQSKPDADPQRWVCLRDGQLDALPARGCMEATGCCIARVFRLCCSGKSQ